MGAEKEVVVAIAGVSAWLEFAAAFQDKATLKEKQTINRCRQALQCVENHFKRQGLIDHPDYDAMVGVFMEAYWGLVESVVIEE